MMLPDQKTKIVATIGPASESPDVMEAMIKAGMNIARINLAHGDYDGHQQVIDKLRAAARAVGRRIAVMADLPGPKMRIGRLAQEPVELQPGSLFTLTTQEIVGDANRVSVSFMRLPQALRPGDTLFLNDGLIQLETLKIVGQEVICRVIVGGELRSHKGLNLPGIDLGIGAFTERDRECLKFALEQGVDAISQSFVESAADIIAVRDASAALGYNPFIIAKIERSRALEHMEDILAAGDGIMVARGDLGVEIPIEQIALVQKQLIHSANGVGKPVITATQMLESMVDNRRPTRAESTDVANAVIDGTDCVMLSEESAMGKYPVEAVAMLAKIAATTELHRSRPDLTETLRNHDKDGSFSVKDLIALSVETALERISPAAVFVPTRSGHTARFIARFRPPVWIVAVSSQEATCQRLLFSRGVYPVYEPDHPKEWNSYVKGWVANHALTGNLAILTEGPSAAHPETNHRMEIIQLENDAKNG
ncbi:MAG: pyruvate kinase [Syntrophobacterales bacterium CG_4_8_14_3_um_filter_58_8]|nr:MAG: pyruvate kinase [Syntrophobacterales bacterium CG03_land_8_20_14_0_80_58_14]PJC71993.1 MAG: pyruvate kinase [Syntrophobacterales bacterium CG_4_8_14_3_um_filter_58_8]